MVSRRPQLGRIILGISLGFAGAADARPIRPRRPNPIIQGAGPFRRVVRSIATYRGELWVGTWGLGLLRRDGAGRWRRYRAATSWLTEDRVNCLARFRDELWIGTCGGLDVLDASGRARAIPVGTKSVAHNVYHAVRAVPGDQLWVGTTGKGLSVLGAEGWITHGSDTGLLDPWINDFLVDPGGGSWVATASGLYSGRAGAWREHRARGTPPPIDTEITALARQGKTLWVGTSDQGLWGLRDGYWLSIGDEFLPPSKEVLALAVDLEGSLWVGTGWGLARYRFDRGFQNIGESKGVPREEIKVLDVDPEGVLRLGTTSGSVYQRDQAEVGEEAHFRRIYRPGDPVDEVLERPVR